MEKISKEQIRDLFLRARMFGAYQLGLSEQQISYVALAEYGTITGYVLVHAAYSTTNGVYDDDRVEDHIEIKIDDLLDFDSIDDMKKWCDEGRELQKRKREEKIQQDLMNYQLLQEKRRKEEYLRLKKEFEKDI